MKRGWILPALVILILSVSFVSAGFFSDLFGAITGRATATCPDSDANSNYPTGLDYNTSGTFGGTNYHDYCVNETTSRQLKEIYCTSSGSPTITVYSCPNGCHNGACINATAALSPTYRSAAELEGGGTPQTSPEIPCTPACPTALDTPCGETTAVIADGCGGFCPSVTGYCIEEGFRCISSGVGACYYLLDGSSTGCRTNYCTTLPEDVSVKYTCNSEGKIVDSWTNCPYGCEDGECKSFESGGGPVQTTAPGSAGGSSTTCSEDCSQISPTDRSCGVDGGLRGLYYTCIGGTCQTKLFRQEIRQCEHGCIEWWDYLFSEPYSIGKEEGAECLPCQSVNTEVVIIGRPNTAWCCDTNGNGRKDDYSSTCRTWLKIGKTPILCLESILRCK